PQYTTNVNNILNWINDNIYHYDNAVKVDVLRAFERVSKSFEQQTFMESAELFFELYNSKYQDIEALKESENMSTDDMLNSLYLSLALLFFASALLLLLRIETLVSRTTKE
ncbi:MAG: hypothetical protein IE916_11670, partial [Epsilonproteobacteria bacterium]|nr:hypothetical protein [Campylobacterota bacterium]